MIRLLGCLCLATVVVTPAQAQRVKSSGFADTVMVSPWNRLNTLSLQDLLRKLPPTVQTEVACPMPVLRPRPSSNDSMPVLASDSTTAPAVNRALIVPSCRNDRFK